MAPPLKYRYPPDSELLALLREHQGFHTVAELLGVPAGPLRQHVFRRPHIYGQWRKVRRVSCPECGAHLLLDGRRSRRRCSECGYSESRWASATERDAARRRAWRYGLAPLDKEFIGVVLADPCSYCGSDSEHLDHIVAVASGGEDGWLNYTGACGRCNRQKGVKSLLGFLANDF